MFQRIFEFFWPPLPEPEVDLNIVDRYVRELQTTGAITVQVGTDIENEALADKVRERLMVMYPFLYTQLDVNVGNEIAFSRSLF